MPEPISVFEPIRTERLLLRPFRAADAKALAERRNDPVVAEFQDWPMPFTADAAAEMATGAAAMPGPTNNEWWALTVADAADTQVLGDLAVHLKSAGHEATIGYTFAREHWGHGYATESVGAFVDWLFSETDVVRVGATLHPDNLRSARVAERCGFDFEGRIKNTWWGDGNLVDDWSYGLTPALRAAWLERPTDKPETVELVEPYPVGLRHVIQLQPHQSQAHFVAPIAASLSQAAVPPFEEGFGGRPDDPRVIPWPRVVHADGRPVGFVMLGEPTEHNPEPYLWRLTVDRFHQGRGIGRRVLEQVAAQAREWDSKSLLVSWVPGIGSPAPMYERFGFVPTGEIDDGEVVARLRLTP